MPYYYVETSISMNRALEWLGVRPVVPARLAADHRATDGRQGTKFFNARNRYLQEPES